MSDRLVLVTGAARGIGAAVARLLARMPGVSVTLVDVDPTKAAIAYALGAGFATPDQAPTDCDLVVHASATAAGLQRALDLLAPEGTVLELSWYGDRPVTLELGAAFHSRRLAIRASQVGTIGPRAGHRTFADRLALALDLLRDPAFAVAIDCSCISAIAADRAFGSSVGRTPNIFFATSPNISGSMPGSRSGPIGAVSWGSESRSGGSNPSGGPSSTISSEPSSGCVPFQICVIWR